MTREGTHTQAGRGQSSLSGGDSAAVKIGPSLELKRLLRLEYGVPAEVAVRLLGVTLGGLLLYLYTGTLLGPIWAAGYLGNHLIYYWFVTSGYRLMPLSMDRTAQILCLALTVSFIWAPAWMMGHDDVHLCLVGAALVASLIVHMVHRSETSVFLIGGQIVVAVGAMAGLLVAILPRIDDPLVLIGLALSWLALLWYFSQSMWQSRKQVLAERKAMAQIVQAQKMSALGQLAGGVAHDFNNTLTAISGNLELFEAVESEDERKEVISAARTASAQAAVIVKQLLMYARETPESLRDIPADAPFGPLEVMLQHLIPSNIAISLQRPHADVRVRADPDHLLNALVNLAINASDAMSGGGRLTIRCILLPGATAPQIIGSDTPLPLGEYVVFEVSDTGHGIPPTLLDTVFQPFFTTKEKGKGTGLGLATVLKTVQGFGGGVSVKSSDTGTAIRLIVPRVGVA